MAFVASQERERTTAYKIRNVVFFMAVIAMNYTLARPSPVDFLFVSAAALSILVNQTIRISFLIFFSLLVLWATSYTVASIPFLDEPVVQQEMFKKTFVVTLGVIAGYVSSSWGPREFETFLKFYVASTTIAALTGIVAFGLGIEPLLWDGRAMGFIDDPNMYGSFLLPAVISCVYFLAYGIGRRLLILAAVFILCIGVMLSFSRAAQVGLAFCVLAYLTFLNRANILRLIAYFVGFGFFASILLGAAVFVSPEFSQKFLQRATLAQSYDSGREGRYSRYARSLPIILENPVGIGIVQQEKIFEEPIHNSVLSSFLNYGWVGGTAWLTLFLGAITLSIQHYVETRSPIAMVLLFGYLSAMLCTLLHEGEHWRHLWLWLGLVWGFNSWNFPRLVARPLHVTASLRPLPA